MKWITLFLQVLSLRKNFLDSQALIEAGQSMAGKGKRFAASFLLLCLCALFLFSALMLAIIDLGLQIDRSGGVGYSGLMFSSTLLLMISLLFGFCSYLVGRSENAPPPPPPPPVGGDRVKELLEEFAVSFLKNLMAKKETQRPERVHRGE